MADINTSSVILEDMIKKLDTRQYELMEMLNRIERKVDEPMEIVVGGKTLAAIAITAVTVGITVVVAGNLIDNYMEK